MSFTRTAVQAQKRYEYVCSQLFMAKHTARGVRFLFRFNMYLFLARSDQVYLILAFTPPQQNSRTKHTRTTYRIHTREASCRLPVCGHQETKIYI